MVVRYDRIRKLGCMSWCQRGHEKPGLSLEVAWVRWIRKTKVTQYQEMTVWNVGVCVLGTLSPAVERQLRSIGRRAATVRSTFRTSTCRSSWRTMRSLSRFDGRIPVARCSRVNWRKSWLRSCRELLPSTRNNARQSPMTWFSNTWNHGNSTFAIKFIRCSLAFFTGASYPGQKSCTWNFEGVRWSLLECSWLHQLDHVQIICTNFKQTSISAPHCCFLQVECSSWLPKKVSKHLWPLI